MKKTPNKKEVWDALTKDYSEELKSCKQTIDEWRDHYIKQMFRHELDDLLKRFQPEIEEVLRQKQKKIKYWHDPKMRKYNK